MNYYNEIDPKAANWLRELIAGGHIPAGDVDERSITEISPNELSKYTQCHFFSGIGGWPLALELAGWPATRPVWTGSCPCQPFSSAGKQLGAADERHLWPAFFNLIRQCRPKSVFGEQVASAIGKGWLDGVSADLESEGYACGATVLGAHSVGAPHIRQRLYWVADAGNGGCAEPINREFNSTRSGEKEPERCLSPNGLADATDSGAGRPGQAIQNTNRGRGIGGEEAGTWKDGERRWRLASGSAVGFWSSAILIPCRDGKARRVEPSIFPLAHGIPGRVGLLRGAGNAIVPQVAAEFVTACSDLIGQNPNPQCSP